RTMSERQSQADDYIQPTGNRAYLNIQEWSVNDVDADPEQLGLKGSPTKVKSIENVVFQAKESKVLTASNEDIEGLIKELILNHTMRYFINRPIYSVFVICEIAYAKIADVSHKLHNKGRRLAIILKCNLVVIVLVSELDRIEKELIPYRTDVIH